MVLFHMSVQNIVKTCFKNPEFDIQGTIILVFHPKIFTPEILFLGHKRVMKIFTDM